MKLVTLFITILISTFLPIQELKKEDNLSKAKIDAVGSMSFARFLKHFEKVDIPKDIDHSEIQELKTKFLPSHALLNKRSSRSADLRNFIPEFVNVSFSRLGPPEVEPLSRFYPDENTVAVTYLTQHKFIGHGFNVSLVVFDLKGNNITNSSMKEKGVLNSKMIAGLETNKTILCSFSNPNSLSITTYRNIWEKDIKEISVKDNSIACYEKEDSNDMVIQSNGDIEVVGQEMVLQP